MKILGKVIEKMPMLTGTSARGPWSMAELVIEFQDGQYTTNLALQNSRDAEKFNKLPIGLIGEFEFSVSSRKSQNGKWFTQCNCYKFPTPAPTDDLPV